MDEFEAWKKEATRHTAKAEVCLDRALVAEYEEAVDALEQATRGAMLEGPAEELHNRVADLDKAIQDKTREFVFESIGRRAWRQLLAEHPPTNAPEDSKAGYNVETFVPAALAASCMKPGLNVAQAEWMAAELPEAVLGDVIEACFRANLQGGDVKKANATAAVALSRSRSTRR